MICDKCEKRKGNYTLGEENAYHLCSVCFKLWQKFNSTEPYMSRIDSAYQTPQWHDIWKSVFSEIFRKNRERKSTIQLIMRLIELTQPLYRTVLKY